MTLKNRPIKYQLIFHMVIVYIMIFLIFIISYKLVADIMMSRSKTYTIDMTSKIKSNITKYYEEIAKITTYIAFNPYTQQYIQSDSAYEEYQLSKELDKVCLNFKDIKPNISDIIIYSVKGDSFYKMSGDFSINNFHKIMLKSNDDGKVYKTGFERKRDYPGPRESMVYYTNIYLNTGYYGEKAGLIGIVVDNRQIFQEIERITPEVSNRYYFLDKNDTMLFNQYSDIEFNEYEKIRNKIKEEHIEDEVQQTLKVDNKNILVYSTFIPEIECKLVSFIPYSEVFKEMVIVERTFILIFIGAAIILAIPMILLLRNILHPLNKFIGFMKSLGNGNLKYLKKKIQVDGYWEITEMSNTFNDMLSEIDKLTYRLIDTNTMLYEAELDKQKIEVSRKTTELAFLRSQINPHFLCNTLESIKGVAMDENADKVFCMLKSLATIFRYSVKGTDFVTLDEEINIVRAYTQIQKIRFSGRINIEFSIDERTKNIKIPKMILQPLVENAIHHGIEGLERNGIVKVSSTLQGEALIIQVEDNGMGMAEERLRGLQEELLRDDSLMSEIAAQSIGVANVNKRIKLIYGNPCGITVKSQYGIGTAITIKIIDKEAKYA